MIEKKASKLNSYFDEKIAICGRRSGELVAEERIDEATFEKIKANVYDIFRTVWSAALRTCKGDPDAAGRFFVQKTEEIPANWAAAYDRAKQYNDAAKMQIEQIKLDTIGEIKDSFSEIWEGAE